MSQLLKPAFLIFLLFPLASCKDSLEAQTKKLETQVDSNRVGTDQDVWLMKFNFLGQYEKVALIFGFMNDYEFCSEVAEIYMNRYPKDKYVCMQSRN